MIYAVKVFGATVEWTKKFKDFLGSRCPTDTEVDVSDEEVDFLEGWHYAIDYHGMRKVTPTQIDGWCYADD